ncbi:MAG: Nif3-like dinuclear metal center hexameric protein [Clostridiales bacterium]|nr:Nif3-like dinuclear metal center hexameric protein [Clostridiales bacterium]
MTTINDIITYFETFAPLSLAMDFDNPGLLVGSKSSAVTRVLAALDITKEVVLEAEKAGCELIISHHPVIFNPIKALSSSSVPYLLAAKGISALCMHTNLDLSTQFGVNLCLAEAIGVKNPTLSEQGECLFIGTLTESAYINAFARNVKTSLECKGLRYTDVKSTVKTVAVSSGVGGSNVIHAAELGADVLVTGEIRHHEILAGNAAGIDIIDAGHFKSEDIVILPLIKKLSDKFPEIKFTKSTACDDMIKYL